MSNTPEPFDNPFDRFIPFTKYVHSRPEIFQTKSAPKHLLRYRGQELKMAGAMINPGRQLMVDPVLMDEFIKAIFREEGSIKPSRSQRSGTIAN